VIGFAIANHDSGDFRFTQENADFRVEPFGRPSSVAGWEKRCRKA
jgi:hypothetical protein